MGHSASIQGTTSPICGCAVVAPSNAARSLDDYPIFSLDTEELSESRSRWPATRRKLLACSCRTPPPPPPFKTKSSRAARRRAHRATSVSRAVRLPSRAAAARTARLSVSRRLINRISHGLRLLRRRMHRRYLRDCSDLANLPCYLLLPLLQKGEGVESEGRCERDDPAARRTPDLPRRRARRRRAVRKSTSASGRPGCITYYLTASTRARVLGVLARGVLGLLTRTF